MTFKELLEKYHAEKTAVFVNGMGVGKIAKIEDDFIDFEVVKEETKTVDKKTEKKLFRETTHIPVSQIYSVSEGKKEIPKSKEQKEIDEDLKGI